MDANLTETTNNVILDNLPNHLKQFIIDQNYEAYTPIDHAVWRYVMRQNHRFLIDHAYDIYLEGLEKTGLKVEAIPSIDDMNTILAKIGWAAVAVNGFIPPSAFMEFQQHRVLPIAADIRQIEHIEYTPSPDIVHEAAGHAPVIADPEYAEYLRQIGAVGAKAMSSKEDFELYEAIRKLSILKEIPGAEPAAIEAAEKDVLLKQDMLGEPSEMALLSRLHWWSVEYGLIGTMDEPKIYGAGLLSSIGEAATCLSPEVQKIPYSINAASYAFGITSKQPQLFVTPDFKKLSEVLEEFADGMAFRVGGIDGLNKAIACRNTSTAVYSSGLQVSGIFSEILTQNKVPIYLKTHGKTNLSFQDKELPGHGIDYHHEGFGSPVGKLKNFSTPLEDLSEEQLAAANLIVGETAKISFESNVTLTGQCKYIERINGKIVLIGWDDCTVIYENSILFNSEWGTFDMAVGEKITSVFSGAADKDAYDQPSAVSNMRIVKIKYSEETKKLQGLYQNIRDYRTTGGFDKVISDVWQALKKDHEYDWLLAVEILEILIATKSYPRLKTEIESFLNAKAKSQNEYHKLIHDGIYLAYNPLVYS
ncbi:MAG: aromatic amino acid hydroxylase [Calditrichaeota bacterium]|nr:MAG: aromatic amino acid hydroxylase [Calditrichota bacterium]